MVYPTKFSPYKSNGSRTLFTPKYGIFPENLDVKVLLREVYLIEYVEKLTRGKLKYAHGFQFKENKNGVPQIIESNPRIQGTTVLSTLAGANII